MSKGCHIFNVVDRASVCEYDKRYTLEERERQFVQFHQKHGVTRVPVAISVLRCGKIIRAGPLPHHTLSEMWGKLGSGNRRAVYFHKGVEVDGGTRVSSLAPDAPDGLTKLSILPIPEAFQLCRVRFPVDQFPKCVCDGRREGTFVFAADGSSKFGTLVMHVRSMLHVGSEAALFCMVMSAMPPLQHSVFEVAREAHRGSIPAVLDIDARLEATFGSPTGSTMMLHFRCPGHARPAESNLVPGHIFKTNQTVADMRHYVQKRLYNDSVQLSFNDTILEEDSQSLYDAGLRDGCQVTVRYFFRRCGN